MTSFWTSPYSETEISCRESSWRTSMSGSCSASWERAARREPCSSGFRAKTTASSAGRGKRAAGSSPSRGSPMASPTRTPPRPRIVAISPAMRTSRRGAPAGANTLIEVGLGLLSPADPHPLTRAERAGEQARVGDALAGGRPLDLEDTARDRGVRHRAVLRRGARRRRPSARRRRCRARPSRRTPDGRRLAGSGPPAARGGVGTAATPRPARTSGGSPRRARRGPP